MSDELKPCPFCGGKAQEVNRGWSGPYSVTCQRCQCGTNARDKRSRVRAAWNRRVVADTAKTEPPWDGYAE